MAKNKNRCKPKQTAAPATKKTCKPKTAKPAPAQCKPKATKTAQTSPKTATKPSDKKSYTVRQGNNYKTFKTKSEAQTCAAQSKSKATITETNKKPTHKIVKFTAKA